MRFTSLEEVPQAEITNGIIKAKFYLPDAEKGYYRATRFDWSGVTPSLEYRGHQYFDQWNQSPYNPKTISGLPFTNRTVLVYKYE